jgi:hypothetical protein
MTGNVSRAVADSEGVRDSGRRLLVLAIAVVIGVELPLYIGYIGEVGIGSAGEGLATLAAEIAVGVLLYLGFRWARWVFVCLRLLHALGILLALSETGSGSVVAGIQIAAVAANLAAGFIVIASQPVRAYLGRRRAPCRRTGMRRWL